MIFMVEETYKKRERYILGQPEEAQPEWKPFEEEEEKIKEVRVTTRESLPKVQRDEIEQLKRLSPKIIGNLFDRVKFLQQRISETSNAINVRQEIHKSLLDEVDSEIADKTAILRTLSDIDDIRDFRLDISNLRAEKRRENVQFWRDVTELNKELRELMDEFQSESKIADIFKDLAE